jgi:hypothetical protein
LSERPGQTEAQRQARGADTLEFILSFRPRDAIELTLCGQTVLFNELLADSARDVTRGLADTEKLKRLSTIVNMARIVQGNLDRLEQRGHVPARAAIASPVSEAAVPETRTGHFVQETSWLDAPFEQWVVETSAELTRRLGGTAVRPALASPEREPAIPRQPSGYRLGGALVDTDAAAD